MKLLMLSTDRALFEADSPVRMRLIEQAELVTHMDVLVLTPQEDRFKEEKVSEYLTLHPTCSRNKALYLVDAYAKGKELLRERNEKDTWLITAQDPFLLGALGYMLARKFALPLHLQLHTDPWSKAWQSERLRNKIEFFIANFLLPRADGIRTVSERVKRSLLALGIPQEKITAIPIFVDVEHFIHAKAAFDLHKSYPLYPHIILSIGRLQPEKNYRKLIRAFKEVHAANSDTMLLIIGSGPERERLLSLIRSLLLEDAVVLLPWARDVASYYKSADLYVQPSLYEGWGLAVIEAMASGVPVVMTDVGCAGEVLHDGESGFVVDANDEHALVSAILGLLSDEARRARFAQRAREEVSVLATKTETLALYKKSWEHAAKIESVPKNDLPPSPKKTEVSTKEKIPKKRKILHETPTIRNKSRKK